MPELLELEPEPPAAPPQPVSTKQRAEMEMEMTIGLGGVSVQAHRARRWPLVFPPAFTRSSCTHTYGTRAGARMVPEVLGSGPPYYTGAASGSPSPRGSSRHSRVSDFIIICTLAFMSDCIDA